MIGKNSARIQVVVTKQEMERLGQMAKKEGRSISNLAAKLLRDALSKTKR